MVEDLKKNLDFAKVWIQKKASNYSFLLQVHVYSADVYLWLSALEFQESFENLLD